MLVLIVPSITDSYEQEYEALSEQHDTLQRDYDDLTASSNETAEKLTAENEELKKQLTDVNYKELQQRAGKLDAIKALFDNDQAVQAAQQLIALNTSGFGNEALEKYENLRKEVLPTAAEEYYTLGEKAEKSGDTDAAKGYYNNTITCSLSETQVKYDAMLRLGVIAQKAGDVNGAKDYFQKVVDNSPSRTAKKEAQAYYDDIVGEDNNN
jgi:tetratricopeptide (TPR) repeat protein